MLKKYIVLLLLLFTLSTYSQFYDSFDDGDFIDDPSWYGNLESFIVNLEYQLQLDAAKSGQSKIYTKYNLSDSMEWGLYLNMDFNPSKSNKLRVYFMVDTPKLSISNGYFIEIGENGTDDNIKFYSLINGQEQLVAEGELGSFSKAPAKAFIKIVRKQDGIWEVFIKKDLEYYEKEFELVDNTQYFSSAYFLLFLTYTSARIDKFVFDDIYAKVYKPDTDPPKIVLAKLLDDKKVKLIFNEPLDRENVLNKGNYSVPISNNTLTEVLFDNNYPNIIDLIFAEPYLSGIEYTLFVNGISDTKGNELLNPESITFHLIEEPKMGDLAINEVLFNPNTGGSDFIELLNTSNKFINIEGVKIENRQKEVKYKVIKEKLILEKGDYICITADTNDLLNDYFIPDTSKFLQMKLPSLDDEKGNITISVFDSITNVNIIIDSFNYSESMHSSFISENDGVSLERINPIGSTNDRFNWTSSSTENGGATPGYKNSSYFVFNQNVKENIYIINNVFSPNFDGVDDELKIYYKFSKSSNLANIYILDARGRFVCQLVNNETLGIEGIVNWDGFVDGLRVPIGVYIVYYNILEESGKVLKGKKAIVIADYLK